MAHERPRFLLDKLKNTLKQAPSVSLLGMRQTGKTTLIKQICKTYLTLDHDQTLGSFRDGKWSSLESGARPVAIDECQKLPEIFDQVKLLIDLKKEMGRFVLTGSVRFLSKKQIKESLTGRTLVLELLPMTLAESHQKNQSNLLNELSKNNLSFDQFVKNHSKKTWCTMSMIDHHLEVGGLPGICFKRDQSLRQDLFEQHIETLLSRDLPMLYQTKVRYGKLKLLLKELALVQGFDWSLEKAAKKVGISGPTARSIVQAFEGLFLVRSVDKRIYLEDAGISNSIISNTVLSPLQLYRSFVYRELLALVRYQYGRSVEITSFTSRGGVDVPFVIFFNKFSLAFTVDEDHFVSEKSIKSIGKFKKANPNSKTIAFHTGNEAYLSSTNVWCLPMTWLL